MGDGNKVWSSGFFQGRTQRDRESHQYVTLVCMLSKGTGTYERLS